MPIERVSGVGRSSLPDDELTVPDPAADAIALCDAIGVGPAHVMGFSMGGAITQELAIARPDLARSLVIVGSWAYSDRLFRTLIESSAYFAGIADDDRKSLMYFLASTYSRAVRGRPRRRPLRRHAEQLAPAGDRGVPAHGAGDPRPRHPRPARHHRAADPRALRRGGRHLPPAPLARDRRPHPRARLVGVPGQAHQPFQEDPAAFNETVLGFWESVGG